MTKLKKMLSSIIGLTFLVALSGCKQSSDKIQVEIGMWPESQLARDVAMFNIWKTRFEADYPQYEIIAKRYDYSTQTIASKAKTKSLPTIFQTWFTEPPMLVSKGYVRGVSAQLKALNWYDKMDVEMRNVLTFDDEVYGVPRDGYGLGLLINLEKMAFCDLMPDEDNDGIAELYYEDGTPAYPQTFEEIYQFSQVIVDSYDNTKGVLILSSNKNGGWQFSNFAWNFGAELQVKNNQGKWTGTLNNPKALEAMEWIQLMKQEDLLINAVTVNYNEWYNKIVDQVAMAFVGNDVLPNCIDGGLEKEKVAFVPMPKGPYGDQYSLFGGTPFVFAAHASDEQVTGALRFLEYMGRSPETSSNSLSALREGAEVARQKGNPILPSILPWANQEYKEMVDEVNEEFINVDMNKFNDFYDTITTIRHAEVPYYAQEMYEYYDRIIQKIFEKPFDVNIESELETANSSFNTLYMSKL